MRKPQVFIPQEPMRREGNRWISKGLNLSAATQFGELRIIWGPETSVLSRQLVLEQASAIANEYDAAHDHIIAVGSPSLIAVLCWAIGRLEKPIRMLEWDRQLRSYLPTMLSNTGNV